MERERPREQTSRTEYEYDAAGRQIAKIGPEGTRTEYKYDALGRRIKTIHPDGTFTTTEYNEAGRRVAETNADSETRKYEYNSMGHLTAAVLPAVENPKDNNELVNPRYKYEYTEGGRLISITDPKGRETSFTYGPQGRRLARTLPMGQTEKRAYNAHGQLDPMRKVIAVVRGAPAAEICRFSAWFDAGGIGPVSKNGKDESQQPACRLKIRNSNMALFRMVIN